MNKWQLIETAPKDGTPILGFADGEMTTVSWLKPKYTLEGYNGYWNLIVCGSYAEDGEWWPEYWMPLPEVPNNIVRKVGGDP